MNDSAPIVDCSAAGGRQNRLKLTIIILCCVIFMISVTNSIPEVLGAIPDIFDTQSLQALNVGDNVITCSHFLCTGTSGADIMIGTQ